MSKILIRNLIVTTVCGISFGAIGMHFYAQHQENGFRDLASIGPSLDKLPGAALIQSKHLALISVRLEAPQEIPVDSQDSVELNGTVTLNHSGGSQDVQIDWNLPEDVRVLRGEVHFQISQMLPGKTYPVSLLVQGFNKTDKKVISVSASTFRNGLKIGNSSLVSSRPEDSMEFIAPKMSESATAAELDSAPIAGKIIK